ncbi:MAG: DNA repair protein RecO [Fusobacteriaceae bacterium]
MKIVSSEGIIIDRYNINDADLMVTIFSESFGKIKTVLKGVRKSKTREQAAVDTLVKSKFIFIKKDEHYTVSKFELLDNFERLKKNLDKLYLAIYILEVINKTMFEGDMSREIYRLSIKTLKYLEKEDIFWKENLCVSYFIFKVISYMGFLNLNDKKFSESLENKTEIGQQLVKNIFSNRMKENIAVLEKINNSEAEKEVFKFMFDIENYINNHMDVGLSLKKYLLR